MSNGKQLFASIVREVFDRKSTKKSLRFFLSGSADNNIPLIGTTWVCIPLGESISNETLFYGDNWEEMEVVQKALLQNCNPLSIGQRCADWFLMRTFHFTGTLASGLGSLDRNVTNENLRVVMDSLLDSWYKRVSSTSAMKVGTANEDNVVDALVKESFILEFYDVGLLQHKTLQYVAVSPDGVIKLIVENCSHLACVEIKTRVSENSRLKAEACMRSYGKVVHCGYNDFRFKSCVPSEHRGQVLHQAFVTGFKYGVYVVSVSDEENGGRILQIIICKISMENIATHSLNLRDWGSRLLDWLYNPIIVNRGFCVEEDFPPWVSSKQKKIIISRSYLWYGYYKFLQNDDGDFMPSVPLKLFKNAHQFNYNKGKGGLDKATEQDALLRVRSILSFESKYVVRMINNILVNTWRSFSAMKFRDWCHGKKEEDLSATKIIQKFPLMDFAANLSESLLKELASEKRSNSESGTNIDHDDCDAVLTVQLNRLKDKKMASYALLCQCVFY